MIGQSKIKRETLLDDEDGRSGVLRDGKTLRVPMMLMDGRDPTGLTPVQKEALCDSINKGVPFDRALDAARSTTTANDVRLHQPGFRGDAAPQAVAAAQASYEARNRRLTDAWRDTRPDVVNDGAPVPKPAQPASAVTRDDVTNALDARNKRLESAYRA